MDQKIYSIVKNKDNIIFLSDIRLNSTNQIAGLNDLEKKLSFYGYKLYHNSRKSSRGVGILISRKLNCTITCQFVDVDDNILLLEIEINSLKFTIGSIYITVEYNITIKVITAYPMVIRLFHIGT